MTRFLSGTALVVCGFWLLLYGQPGPSETRLWQFRNLGKAFYENPTTQKQAVEQFRLALNLAPQSIREQVNYGLALLRAGDAEKGIAMLQKVQKADPKLPHTWFNLGVALQKQADFDAALEQFRGMLGLIPNEPISHYHVGALLKLKGDMTAAIAEFEKARDLNPRLAAPHFQLYGLYRQTNRPDQAAVELKTFQEIKKLQEGAAVPEDMDWSYYSEIYDPLDAPNLPRLPAPVYRDEKIADGYTGLALIAFDGIRPGVIAWSKQKVTLFRGGSTPVAGVGLDELRDVVAIAPGDFDNDGLPDLCVVTTTGAELYRNERTRFRKSSALASGSFRTAFWIDYDHDYDPDLILLGSDSKLLRNNGEAGFGDVSARFPFALGQADAVVRTQVEPDTPGFDFIVRYTDGRSLLYRDRLGGSYEVSPGATLPPESTIADFSSTGHADRVSIKDGAYFLHHDVTPNAGNWLDIALTGVKNAKMALDAVVEIKAGTRYERAIYRGVPLVFRLGNRAQVDTVRINWPNGLIQNEMQQTVNRVLTIKEAPRLSGSCPMIFTWDGQRFRFITDVLGVAPLGASSGDGRYFPVDHDEYVSIAGDALQPHDGAYELRITEELREVSYLDQVQLISLDHPADQEVVTNEKFKAPPFPEFRLYGVKHPVRPVSARDSLGNDVRFALNARDGVYADSFERNSAGTAQLHALELDFGAAAQSNRAVLILNGWVDWADGSTFLAATQAHRDLVFPYLQVKDAAGNWKTVIDDMGIPSGKPKPMAVDLSGKFLSGSRQVRIVTSLCVYWDQIFLLENSDPPAVRMTALPPARADLQFHGFSKPTIHPQRKQPEMFDYHTLTMRPSWNPTAGNYTRYGAVGTLLADVDDRMVVMGSGDEVRLRFDPAGLPPLPAGWKRDFLLLVDGWAKDSDANTAFSQSVLPLPFHAMSSYPYPSTEQYPRDQVHQDYVRDYLNRPALRLVRGLRGERSSLLPQ